MSSRLQVEVEGLGELSRSARRAGKEHAANMRRRFKDVAELVASSTREKMPERTGKARASVRAQGDNRGASVIGGRSTVRYYGWLDFGGVLRAVGKRRNEQTRERPPRGRFIYVALDERRDDLLTAAQRSVADTIREAGL